MAKRAIQQQDMRKINRAAVLDYIRTHGKASRTEIAHNLGLSAPTIIRIIQPLLDERLIKAVGLEQEREGRGRQRELLKLNDDENVVITIDLGGTKLYGALVTIGAGVVDEYSFRLGGMGGNAFEETCRLIHDLKREAEKREYIIRGIAVGAPGLVDQRDGVVRLAPGLDWHDFPLREKLCSRFTVPVAVENDVNLAVLGEQWYGAGQGKEDLVLMSVGTGIGTGIILGGVLHRGFNDASGEIGYLLPDVSFLGREYAGFGALESLASGTGIAGRARKTLRDMNSPEDLVNAVTAEDVFSSCRKGDSWALKVIEDTVDYLALGVVAVSALLNPEVIILGGGVAASADLFISPLRERVRGAVPNIPEILVSTLGNRASAFGGIVKVLHQIGEFNRVRNMS